MENNTFTSFTITQPFLGAPLQFRPALGSKQLEVLVDAFVPGTANKQDKLSQVTIDFFNHATVDLLTGALVRRYDVALPYANEQSPYDSQSSGLSPLMFTPSPSSSATFGDSARGSVSTPPVRANRITKKAKKETKKMAEAKIPGFQIMTKDGVDVTSSAGRGTKTKEQREHAHLMRIMKACDACKKKKIRCDPSHRRSHTEMSRTATQTTSSSGLSNQSPAVSTPSLTLSRENTNASTASRPSYGASVMDDFVLFPSETATWNPTDMSMPDFDQNYDLGQFNFDIDDAGIGMSDLDQSFDFSSFEQLDVQQPYYPLYTTGHNEDALWEVSLASPTELHVRPPPSNALQHSGKLDWSCNSDVESGLEFNSSPRSRVSSDSSCLNSTPQTPALQDSSTTNASSVSFAAMDWSMNDLASGGDSDGDVSPYNHQPKRHPATQGTMPSRLSEAAIQRLLAAVPSYSSESGTFIDSSDQRTTPVQESGSRRSNSSLGNHVEDSSPSGFENVHRDISGISVMVNASLEGIRCAPDGYESLSRDLTQLRNALDAAKSGNLEGIFHGHLVSATQSLGTELQGLFTNVQHTSANNRQYRLLHPSVNPQLVRQCSISARRLAKTIRVTIDNSQHQNLVPADQLTPRDIGSANLQLLWGKPNQGDSDVPQGVRLSVLTHLSGFDTDSGYSSCSRSQSLADSTHSTSPETIRAAKAANLLDSSGNFNSLAHVNFGSSGRFVATSPVIINKVSLDLPISRDVAQGHIASSINFYELPSSALVSTVENSTVSSSSSVHNSFSLPNSPQLLSISREIPTAVQTASTLLQNTPQLTFTQSTESSSDLFSRSVSSSADASLYHNERCAWGAIPQTVRRRHLQPLDTNDIVKRCPQNLENGLDKNRLLSMTAMTLYAVLLIVTILQLPSLGFAKTPYISTIDIALLINNLSAVSGVLLTMSIIACSFIEINSTSSLLPKITDPYSVKASHQKTRPIFEFSKMWLTFQSSILNSAITGRASSFYGLVKASRVF